jgi:hypothetical protein
MIVFYHPYDLTAQAVAGNIPDPFSNGLFGCICQFWPQQNGLIKTDSVESVLNSGEKSLPAISLRPRVFAKLKISKLRVEHQLFSGFTLHFETIEVVKSPGSPDISDTARTRGLFCNSRLNAIFFR